MMPWGGGGGGLWNTAGNTHNPQGAGVFTGIYKSTHITTGGTPERARTPQHFQPGLQVANQASEKAFRQRNVGAAS